MKTYKLATIKVKPENIVIANIKRKFKVETLRTQAQVKPAIPERPQEMSQERVIKVKRGSSDNHHRY